MYRYLSSKTADYTTTIFSVKPTTVLPQVGDKSQVVHTFDDGTVSVIGLSSNTYFEVELQWAYITATDHGTLMEFWNTSTMGDGRRRTFYWLHPTDAHNYTVRFMSPLKYSYSPVGHLSVSSVTLRVEGNKPA